MTLTCPRAGQIWATEASRQALGDIQALGASAAAIHPYAWLGRDGSLRRDSAYLGAVSKPLGAWTRERGMGYFVKPHIGYWGSGFSWRGEIGFGGDAEAWERFFADYEAFIVDAARAAAEADAQLFAVGVELNLAQPFEAEWRRVIAAVREAYPGRLVYAANWDALDSVEFWDALDAIGVQGYFPVGPEEPALATEAAIREGWREPLERLRALSEREGKPVIFTELGYDAVPWAAARPWEGAHRHGPEPSPETAALQKRLLATGLRALEEQDFVEGAYLWKWCPSGTLRENFRLQSGPALEGVREAWGKAEQ